MTIRNSLLLSASVLLLASGCAHSARVKTAHLEESGTHVVATPGALTIAQKSASASHVCTLRTPGAAKMKKGKRGMGGGPPPGAGPGAMLDTLMFRLCEARANNDISPEQYAASVQLLLKTMSEMAQRPPMPMAGPGMGMGMGMGRPGMGMGRPGMDRRGNRRGGPAGWDGPRKGPGRGGPPDADDDDEKREKKKDK